jgi:hypothetical protein
MKTKLTIVYVAFFVLIGFAVWVTKSAVPLWSLLLTNAVPKFLAEEVEKDNKSKTNEEIQN